MGFMEIKASTIHFHLRIGGSIIRKYNFLKYYVSFMFHLKTYLMKICFFMCLTFFCGIINMVEDIYGRKQTFCLILNFKREDMMIKGLPTF